MLSCRKSRSKLTNITRYTIHEVMLVGRTWLRRLLMFVSQLGWILRVEVELSTIAGEVGEFRGTGTYPAAF